MFSATHLKAKIVMTIGHDLRVILHIQSLAEAQILPENRKLNRNPLGDLERRWPERVMRSASFWLCDLGQVTSPLWADSPPAKWVAI